VLEIAEDLDGSLRTSKIRKIAGDLDGSLRISKIWKIAEDLDGSLGISKTWKIAEDLDGSLRISKIYEIAEDLDGSLRTSKICEIAEDLDDALSAIYAILYAVSLYLLVLKAHVGLSFPSGQLLRRLILQGFFALRVLVTQALRQTQLCALNNKLQL
jgi:hypothetical protein